VRIATKQGNLRAVVGPRHELANPVKTVELSTVFV
jgi:hypothetical protein